MPTIDIHGKQVHIDGDSHSAKSAAEYLQKLDKSEAHNFFETASNHGFSHLEVPHHYENRNIEHDMTLEHRGDGTYYLRKRI